MSEFLELYREKNRIKAQMRRIRKKSNPEKYWELDDKQKAINDRLNQIIKDDTRIQKGLPMEGADKLQGEDIIRG